MPHIFISRENEIQPRDHEFLERKGVGHPDTLADALAEFLSSQYSLYCLKEFGIILHHNFDKVGLLGGASYVSFGRGYMTSPIRVLLNCRVSKQFGNKVIPLRELLTHWVEVFFKNKLYNVNPKNDLELHFNLSSQSSPGKVYEHEQQKNIRHKWFAPKTKADIPESKRIVSNDTSLGVGYAPVSPLEQLVLSVERKLNCQSIKKGFPWLGTDIKILAVRQGKRVYLTICIPQIADFVSGIDIYSDNLRIVQQLIRKEFTRFPFSSLELSMNTRDNLATKELYLTATGSAIESGDEGLVGRGNRVNGLISPTRPMSMEGASGKNPVYHIGKLYYIGAFELADKIYQKFGITNEVYLASQSGRPLLDPWIVTCVVPTEFNRADLLTAFIKKEVRELTRLTAAIVKRQKKTY